MASKSPLSRRLTDSQNQFLLSELKNLKGPPVEIEIRLYEAFTKQFPGFQCSAKNLFAHAFKIDQSEKRRQAAIVFEFSEDAKRYLKQSYVNLLSNASVAERKEKLGKVFKDNYPHCRLSQNRLWELAKHDYETNDTLVSFY